MLLSLLPQNLAVVRLEPDSDLPSWAMQAEFYSITRTSDELSIFGMIDGKRSVRQIIKESGLLDYRFYKCLSSLISSGFVKK